MVHSRFDAVESTSLAAPRQNLDADKDNRLDASDETNHDHHHHSSETVVNQQLANMEIDTHAPLPNALLRHRLFPRAMAWNVHQAAQHSYTTARYDHDRAFPARDAEYASGYASSEYAARPLKTAKHHAHGSPRSALAASQDVDDRERLFRTIGKYLNQRPSTNGYSQPQFHHHQEASYPYACHASSSFDGTLPRGGSPSIYDMVHLHHGGHSPSYSGSTASRSMSISSPTHSHSSDGSSSKKRQRGPSGSTVPPVTSGSAVARPGMSTSSAKRCSVQDCGKIAVSKGLCRGHGGGRRCTFAGCTKCAQSRSPFCWAHGGGKRCEAPNCRRSRKTKRFCVDHVEMEATVPLSTDSDSDHRPHADKDASASHGVAEPHNLAALHLPSLTDALKRAVPAAVARAAQTVTLPQSRDRLWPVAPSAASFH